MLSDMACMLEFAASSVLRAADSAVSVFLDISAIATLISSIAAETRMTFSVCVSDDSESRCIDWSSVQLRSATSAADTSTSANMARR